MSGQYHFEEWIKKHCKDERFTPSVYQTLENAYAAGYSRGDEKGYIQGRSIGKMELKKALIEAVEEKFSRGGE